MGVTAAVGGPLVKGDVFVIFPQVRVLAANGPPQDCGNCFASEDLKDSVSVRTEGAVVTVSPYR